MAKDGDGAKAIITVRLVGDAWEVKILKGFELVTGAAGEKIKRELNRERKRLRSKALHDLKVKMKEGKNGRS